MAAKKERAMRRKHFTRRMKRVLVVLSVLGLFAACGGDDDGSGVDASTIPDARPPGGTIHTHYRSDDRGGIRCLPLFVGALVYPNAQQDEPTNKGRQQMKTISSLGGHVSRD